MRIYNFKIILLIAMMLLLGKAGYALEAGQILVIANSDSNCSVQLAGYYCQKRNVPTENIVELPLGKDLPMQMSRESYNEKLAKPLREILESKKFEGKIRCLLTTYGVPVRVSERGILTGQNERLETLKKLLEESKNKLKQLEIIQPSNANEQKKNLTSEINQLQSEYDYLSGKESNAAVDSELSMVLFDDYELYRWQPNMLRNNVRNWDGKTMMVSRLDGPGFEIAKGLVDKAIAAQTKGLMGIAYFDSRGIADDKKRYSFGFFDQSIRDAALLTGFRTNLQVKQENTEKLFPVGSCPQTALYCGWYSLKNYIDAFEFVDGAIGYHIASWEAIDLRDPNSSQWCPAMLKRGLTATIGAVAEPYLHSFPPPKDFFLQLFNGKCLVEAYYDTQPLNSWQLILIGDPLYTPFKKR